MLIFSFGWGVAIVISVGFPGFGLPLMNSIFIDSYLVTTFVFGPLLFVFREAFKIRGELKAICSTIDVYRRKIERDLVLKKQKEKRKLALKKQKEEFLEKVQDKFNEVFFQ